MYDYALIVRAIHNERIRQIERKRPWVITQPALPRRLLRTLGNALVALGTRLQPGNPPAAHRNRLRKA